MATRQRSVIASYQESFGPMPGFRAWLRQCTLVRHGRFRFGLTYDIGPTTGDDELEYRLGIHYPNGHQTVVNRLRRWDFKKIPEEVVA